MAKILEMPKLSPTMEEGQLATWAKKEGDEVAIDDVLAEVETDKATMEFRSFDKGTLLKILAPAGATVKLGQPVAILGEKGEDITELLAKSGGGEGASAPAEKKKPEGDDAKPAEKDEPAEEKPAAKEPADKDGEKEPKEAAEKTDAQPAKSAPGKDESPRSSGGTETVPPAATRRGSAAAKEPADDTQTSVEPEEGRVRASPYVRKLAREQEIDLHGVSGSGPHGRIIARDLENAPAPKTTGSPAATPGKLRAPVSKPLSMMRKTIARRLAESKKTVPHFYLTIDIDAGALSSLREDINADLLARGKDKEHPEKISLNDLIVKASAISLARVPECNAEFAGDAILYHQRVDISVAVAVAEGLLTPVLRDADKKSVRAIAREIRELAARAKTKKLAPEEMSNGTFSISNLGMFGIDEFSAVINPPEGAILAVGRVREEPIVKDGAVVPGKRMSMTLSCDHRVIDGAVGARFLAELRSLLERPLGILVDG